jgi:uncharacterized protein YndB with AHSA1/START domain
MAVTVRQTGPTSRELSFVTALAPEQVYDYLADFPRHREWVDEIVSMEPIGSGPAGVGTTYKTVEAMKPGSRMKAPTYCEITALERPRRIAWTARTGATRGPMAMRSRWAFLIAPDNGGSRVTQQAAMEPPNRWSRGFLRLFTVLADGLGGGMGASPKNVTKHAERLRQQLDQMASR